MELAIIGLAVGLLVGFVFATWGKQADEFRRTVESARRQDADLDAELARINDLRATFNRVPVARPEYARRRDEVLRRAESEAIEALVRSCYYDPTTDGERWPSGDGASAREDQRH